MGARRRYAPGEAEAIFAAEAAGETRQAIAARTGRTPKALARLAERHRRIKARTGAPDHRRPPAGGWPEDKPFPQSAAGMTRGRWRALLARRLAGECTRALAAEHGVSVSAVHYQAKTMRMRKMDHADATWLPKGPAPVRVEADEEGLRVVCADMAFRFDRDDPVATLAGIHDCLELAAVRGDDQRASRLLRLGSAVLTLDEKLDRTKRRRESRGEGADPRDVPGPPFELHTAQQPPKGDWRTWLFLGGRGAGKTLAGAEWLADQAELLGPGGRVALIGPTLHDVREVMIEGVSGIRSLPRWTRRTRPVYQPSRRRLYFANGCVAYAFSAEDPDSLRGPQFSAAWADELCAWPAHGARGAAETLAMLRMGLRLPLRAALTSLPPGEGDPPREGGGGGACAQAASDRVASDSAPGAQAASDRVASDSAPKLCVTTTPKPSRALVRLKDEPTCVHTHAPTAVNAANLSAGFIDDLKALYGGTRREAQELDGQIVDLDGALFTAEMMRAARLPSLSSGEGDRDRSSSSAKRDRAYDRVVIALDPPATVGGDACGLIAAARRVRPDGRTEAVILADRTARGLSPEQWARRALLTAQEFGAAAVVAEVNQGGDMVRSVLIAAGVDLRVVPVRAATSKRARAEPVAALYEQGRVRHAGAFDALEEELMLLGGEMEGTSSLDRADALVWAVTHLLLEKRGEGPRVRRV